jgi:hypothetical protein
MTLEVRVLADEFASVMGVSLRHLAGTVARHDTGVQLSFPPEAGIQQEELARFVTGLGPARPVTRMAVCFNALIGGPGYIFLTRATS